MDDNIQFKIKCRQNADGVVFFIQSEDDEEDMVPLVNFNPQIYFDFTKKIDDFMRELSIEIIRKGTGELDAQLDIIKGSELN